MASGLAREALNKGWADGGLFGPLFFDGTMILLSAQAEHRSGSAHPHGPAAVMQGLVSVQPHTRHFGGGNAKPQPQPSPRQ